MASLRTGFVALFALALGTIGPSVASAADGSKAELGVPSAPSEDVEAQLAEVLGAIDPGVHAPFHAVVDDAKQRLRANQREVAKGKAEPLSLRDACRAAARDSDFGGIGKRRGKVLATVVDLAVLQLIVDLHAGLREGVGRQLAIRKVRACGGEAACLDAIAPTATMKAHHIAAVRTLAGKTTELAAAEIDGTAELEQLGTIYEGTGAVASKIMANAHEMKKSLIANFPR